MARDYFRAEMGLHLTGENTDSGVKLLFGSGAPSMDAEVASLYLRTDDGTQWRKIASGAGAGNWEKVPVLADITQIKFRKEAVVALTATAAPVSGGTIDLAATPLAGDEGTTLAGADFTPNVSHILFGHGGTEKLMKVSAVAGDVITVVDASPVLANGDCFVVDNYLPDSPAAQEGMALVAFNGTDYIKLGDVDWSFATGINLSAGYTPGSGNVTSSDSVESAIQKLDGNNDAQDTLLGTSQGATNLGNFTGTTITDNNTVKGALQELETAVEAINDLTKAKVSGITTVQTIDSMLCRSYYAAKWFVVATLDSNPAQKQAMEIFCLHDGTQVADATTTDEVVAPKIKTGANFNLVVSTDVNGTGAAQTMRLRVSASAAVTVTVTRLEVNY